MDAHGQAHVQRIQSLYGGMPIVYMYLCVGGNLQHFEEDMIIGHCTLRWSIYSFVWSIFF